MKELAIITEKSPLSLHDGCPGCACCMKDTPIVSQKERDRIVEATGNDCFERAEAPEGELYFVIGRKADGTKRDIPNEPCPYNVTSIGGTLAREAQPVLQKLFAQRYKKKHGIYQF